MELLEQARTMRLYTMDAWVADPAVLTDESLVRAALHAGARAGHALVLGEADGFCHLDDNRISQRHGGRWSRLRARPRCAR